MFNLEVMKMYYIFSPPYVTLIFPYFFILLPRGDLSRWYNVNFKIYYFTKMSFVYDLNTGQSLVDINSH